MIISGGNPTTLHSVHYRIGISMLWHLIVIVHLMGFSITMETYHEACWECVSSLGKLRWEDSPYLYVLCTIALGHGPAINKKEELNWASVFTALCFMTTGTRWPDASSSYVMPTREPAASCSYVIPFLYDGQYPLELQIEIYSSYLTILFIV